jgi:hypothetical protein
MRKGFGTEEQTNFIISLNIIIITTPPKSKFVHLLVFQNQFDSSSSSLSTSSCRNRMNQNLQYISKSVPISITNRFPLQLQFDSSSSSLSTSSCRNRMKQNLRIKIKFITPPKSKSVHLLVFHYKFEQNQPEQQQ